MLAGLSDAEFARWEPRLEATDLPLGRVLYEAGGRCNHVYFPTSAVVSLLSRTEDGGATEIAVVGHEGVVGVALFMGGESMPSQAVVQASGHGYRIEASAVMEAFHPGSSVMHMLLRYTQALITQVAQTAVCYRRHSLDQQLSRWLLLILDRLGDTEVRMTHEMIAAMIGVRREGVTAAAGKLQEAGLIRYARGRIRVLDRCALESRSCECYSVVRREYDRLLPQFPER